ncbi:MAG: tyrosinase family protein, partial [Ardenticatenaceae bacterium]|nr:tyrosinase family protein [Ardenticatenaceae bacterium]
MNCRKNIKNLSTGEKTELVQAFLDLKNPAKAPSQIPAAQARGANSRYDDYVWLHTVINTGAHRRPGFLAWHRKFLDLLEKDLQDVAVNPNLTLPYWDWTDLSGSNPFTSDFLGGEGDGPNNRVTTGAFAYATGNWNLNIPPESSLSIDPWLTRKSPLSNETFATLPTAAEVLTMLNVTPLDASPWNDTSSNDGFRNRIEGWFGAPPVRFHNAGHVYVGGSMNPDSSPNDPVFFLHHANVDRLWAIWQQKHPTEPYVPGSGESATLAGHRLGDNMALFGAHFGTDYTIDSVLDHKAGGYMYDTDIPSVTLDTPSIDFGNVPVGMTTYHAIRFRVESARQVRFRITAGPSGNFSQTPVSVFTAVPECGEPFVYGYVFVAYTSPNTITPTENSSVTVEAYFTDVEGFYTTNPGDDYSLLTETIDLLATPVPIQKTAVALVLDRSGSMGSTATTSSTGVPITKAELLKNAISVFSALMRPEDGIGVVTYDDIVDRLLNVTEMGPYSPIAAGSGRDGINAILSGAGLDPRGLTGIGAAIQEGKTTLADGQAAANAL